MSDTHVFDAAKQIQSQIRDHVDLTGDAANGLSGIPNTHVQLWQAPYDPSSESHFQAPTPSVIISMPRSYKSPPEEGYNSEDWVNVDYLIQVCDRTAEHNNENRIALWTKWIWRLHRIFHMSNLRNEITGVEGRLQLAWCPEMEFDEKIFTVAQNAIHFLPVRVRFSRTRDTDGSL